MGKEKILKLESSNINWILEMVSTCDSFTYAENDTITTLNSYFTGGSFIVGKFVDTELAGYAILSLRPGEDVNDLITKYNVITDRKVWGNVGILNNCVISDNYRGRGYQLELLKIREEAVSNFGLNEIFTSVHVRNTYSINNLVKAGYKQIGQHYIQKEWLLFIKTFDKSEI